MQATSCLLPFFRNSPFSFSVRLRYFQAEFQCCSPQEWHVVWSWTFRIAGNRKGSDARSAVTLFSSIHCLWCVRHFMEEFSFSSELIDTHNYFVSVTTEIHNFVPKIYSSALKKYINARPTNSSITVTLDGINGECATLVILGNKKDIGFDAMGAVNCKEACDAFMENIDSGALANENVLHWFANVPVDANGCRKFSPLHPSSHPRYSSQSMTSHPSSLVSLTLHSRIVYRSSSTLL